MYCLFEKLQRELKILHSLVILLREIKIKYFILFVLFHCYKIDCLLDQSTNKIITKISFRKKYYNGVQLAVAATLVCNVINPVTVPCLVITISFPAVLPTENVSISRGLSVKRDWPPTFSIKIFVIILFVE